MTLTGATCKGILQLEATFIDVKDMYLDRGLNPGVWNTIPVFLPLRHDQENASRQSRNRVYWFIQSNTCMCPTRRSNCG